MLLSVDSLNLDNYDLLYRYTPFNKELTCRKLRNDDLIFIRLSLRKIYNVGCLSDSFKNGDASSPLPPLSIDHQKK